MFDIMNSTKSTHTLESLTLFEGPAWCLISICDYLSRTVNIFDIMNSTE